MNGTDRETDGQEDEWLKVETATRNIGHHIVSGLWNRLMSDLWQDFNFGIVSGVAGCLHSAGQECGLYKSSG